MLAKAFIQEVISPYSLRVRIPSVNKIEGVNGATPNNELYVAAVCSNPNFVINAHVGDVVILGFEDDDISKPIVLGYLSTNKSMETLTNMHCDEFKADGDISLSGQTSIGDVSPSSIHCLKNQKENISDEFHSVRRDAEELKKSIEAVDIRSSTNKTSISDLSQLLGTLSSQVTTLLSDIGTLTERCNTLDDKFENYIQKYPTIFDERSYGSNVSEITNPSKGQIYLTIKDDD